MNTLNANKAIPDEFRPTAEALFPPEGFPDGIGPDSQAILNFAELLGIGWDYQRLLQAKDDDLENFLESFRNNIDLLIQKTWVAKDDEMRKEHLQDRVQPFIEEIQNGNYQAALAEFGDILDELAYLLFGAQSRKDDFTEYTMRIDLTIGLFWWYGSQLGTLSKITVSDSFYPVLLVGMCYLANF
jgi:hypothetical protein